jgi:multiple sugar transport system permease protein
MTEDTAFFIGVLLHGAACCLSVWLLVGLARRIAGFGAAPAPLWPWGLAAALATVAMVWPLDLGRPEPQGPWVPVAWPVMPLPAWALAASSAAVAAHGWKSALAATRDERARQYRALAVWTAMAVACAAWGAALNEPVRFLRGAVPVSMNFILAALSALVLAAGITARLEGRLRRRGLSGKVAVTVGLVAGSVVFSVPLFWLLLTSFKEHQDNAGSSGLVWVPRVTATRPFVDPERPLVKALFHGQEVEAKVIGRSEEGLSLEVERPFSLRGWRFVQPKNSVRPVPRHGPVVEWLDGGQLVRGFVKETLPGGAQRVEAFHPDRFKGRVFDLSPGQASPVREPGLRWQNYPEALEWLPLEAQGGAAYLRNTVWLVVLSVLGNVMSCSVVAYGFARLRFAGRSVLFGALVSTLMLPAAVTMLPRFMLWRDLGYMDSLVPLWLPTFFASAFNVFLLRQFFLTVPVEMEQAAKIDGCSPPRIFWHVSLPQIKPALMVVGLWSFMGAWNDFMGPLIYVNSPEKMPLTYGLQLFYSDRGSDFGLMMAFATLSIVPVFLVFLFGQRYLTEGAHLTGLAGR